MNRSILIATFFSIFSASALFAQVISFSNPTSWLTQRNDTIFIRAQLDTALLKKKTVSVALLQVNDGKKKVVAKKNLKVTDNVLEMSFGKVGKNLLGGREYLRLEWSVPDSGEKGVIEPIGILNLEKVQKIDPVKAFRVADDATAGSVAGSVTSDQFKKLGNIEFGTAWNMKNFYIVLKKSQENNIVRFMFDGKNGKNAFLSYPDRIVSYKPVNDSISAIHYSREISSDTLKYLEKKWHCELTKETLDDKVVISLPWADIGVIPFEERLIGFGMFNLQSNGAVLSSIPEKAQPFIPGTWADVLLQK